MRQFLGGLIYLTVGVLAGAFSAYLAIENAGVEAVGAGSPWLSRTAALSGGSSLYVRSHYLMSGRLPPAQGQIREVSAQTDGESQPLSGACRYRIAATGPLPQWWSLAVIGSGGEPSSQQSTADAGSIVRGVDGLVAVVASAVPQPGNWLKIPGARQFTLLYSASPAPGPAATVPPFSITREGC